MSNTTDWAAQAAALSERDSKFWKPEAGDSIAGRLVGIEIGAGKKGNSTVYELEAQDGATIALWGSAVIDSKFKRLGVKRGSIVALKFLGTKTGQSGNEFKDFAVKRLDVPEDEFADDVPW